MTRLQFISWPAVKRGGDPEELIESPARWAAGVTPAPSVHSQIQRKIPRTVFCSRAEVTSALSVYFKVTSKICAAQIFVLSHWVKGSALAPTAQVIFDSNELIFRGGALKPNP
jgi:hypothetical protein